MTYNHELFINELLTNKPFLKEFFKQYLGCLNDKEYQEFFRQFINSYDGSLSKNKKFYSHKPLIQKINGKLIPMTWEVHEQK